MADEMSDLMDRGRRGWVFPLAIIFWLVAWACAVGYGHGFEFQRMVASIPGVVLAGVLLLPGLRGARNFSVPGVALVGLSALYLAWRGWTSPVWDLARLDLLLVFLGLLSVVLGMRLGEIGRGAWLLIGGCVVVFLANWSVALIQATSDPEFAFLRSPRADQAGVSGLFWHRNYLAGMLELMLPLFVGLLVVAPKSWRGILFGLLLGAGLLLAFYTRSRGGLFAVGVGCAVSFLVWMLVVCREKSRLVKMAVVGSGIGVLAVFLVVVLLLVSKVSDLRGHEDSVDGALTDTGVRLAMAGCSYDQWAEAPLVGTGARTFSYLSVRHWPRGKTQWSLGNPEMAHNDFLQLLAEYGLVGFVLVVGTLSFALWKGMRSIFSAGRSDSVGGMALRIGAVGGIAGAMVHSCVDFTLHILPNTLMCCLLVGICFSGPGGRKKSSSSGRERGGSERRTAVMGGLVGLLVLGAIVGAVFTGGAQLKMVGRWFSFEQSLVREGMTPEKRGEFGEILELAPDFELSRAYGRMLINRLGKEGRKKELIEEGVGVMKVAVERHPFDGESRLVYANFLELAGDEDGAAREYLAGVEATWRREDKYGGLAGFGDHLARRAEIYFRNREPETALAFFRRSLEYHERARELNYRKSTQGIYDRRTGYLKGRIELLEGAGIRAEDLGEMIPPPE